MKLNQLTILTLFFTLFSCSSDAQKCDREGFEKLLKMDWETKFQDNMTSDWTEQWSLDGTKASISHSENGMDFYAGPEFHNDTHHAVLWSKEYFKAESIKIEYDYTRLDTATSCVTILYFMATGDTTEDKSRKEIFNWSEERKVPAMRLQLFLK